MKSILSFVAILMLATSVVAQPAHPRKSPVSIAAATANGGYVKVVYGSPYINGREIFGALVPYQQVWRTGANEATEITFTKDVTFGGADVPAGTYSVFSLPGEREWTVILNKGLGMWGTYTYKEDQDLVRVAAAASTGTEVQDPFRITLKAENEVITMTMAWDKTVVTLPIVVK
jgi:hypothetical protein